MRRDGLLLEDIVAAADAVAEFIAGHTAETLASNKLVRSAVVARLAAAVRDENPKIPWTDIKGLRNVVVHNYFGIDWAKVWSAASTDIPVLRSQIFEILREYPEAG